MMAKKVFLCPCCKAEINPSRVQISAVSRELHCPHCDEELTKKDLRYL
jgi:DNA-directed RNA polymerase subunit RPC12/RpoP